jgi:hypothetical protein
MRMIRRCTCISYCTLRFEAHLRATHRLEGQCLLRTAHRREMKHTAPYRNENFPSLSIVLCYVIEGYLPTLQQVTSWTHHSTLKQLHRFNNWEFHYLVFHAKTNLHSRYQLQHILHSTTHQRFITSTRHNTNNYVLAHYVASGINVSLQHIKVTHLVYPRKYYAGSFFFCWSVHGSALHSNRCIVGCETHTKFANESIFPLSITFGMM